MKRMFSALAALMVSATAAVAAEPTGLERVGKPIQDGLNFQPASTELARDIVWLDNILLVIITLISLFVVALLAWVVIRYNEKSNPEPASFTHNSTIEVAWTIVPCVILIGIGAISLPVLFKQLEIPDADVTIKVTGNQWNWTYEYPDEEIEFDSIMLEKDELADYGYSDDEYLLATDNAVVIPVNKNIVMQVTGSDVIHAWKMPAFGVHMDAVPGRLAEIWFSAEREGVYFGQCSELCGQAHSYMPIVVKVVSEEQYAEWLEYAQEEFASRPSAVNVASAD
jgi:cytochrome c oxidase subunit 2